MTPPPQLEMLWEAVDSKEALTTRFGFADSNDATLWFEDMLRDAWGVRLQSCDRLVISADKLLAWLNVEGRPLIAKCAINPALFARLAEIDKLVTWLGGEGIPVAAPLPANDGRMRIGRDRSRGRPFTPAEHVLRDGPLDGLVQNTGAAASTQPVLEIDGDS